MMSCCADSFGTFAVQKFVRGYGLLRPETPLFFCLVIDIIVLVMLFVGKVLDDKKIWLFSGLSKADTEIGVDRTVKIDETS